MQISGRVSNSFFCFLNQHQFDTSQFHELTQIEMNFITDPSVWMSAPLVEDFLKNLSIKYGKHFVDKKLTTIVGHEALNLGAWGDLDQILKLSQPSDLYQKIENILQWFISPLSFRAFQNKEEFVAFQCNFSSKKYPCVADYIRAVMEVLPSFKSGKITKVQWEGEKVQIQLSPSGQMVFVMDEEDSIVSPDFVKKLKKSIFLLERECLKQKRLLEEQDQQIKQFQSDHLSKEKIQSLCYQAEKILDQVQKGSFFSKDYVANNLSELYQCINRIKTQIKKNE